MNARKPSRVTRGGLVTILLSAAFLASCSDTLPVTPLQPLKTTRFYEVRWHTSLGSKNAEVLFPALYEDALYLASADGELMSLDPSTGKENWRVKTHETFSAGVGDGDDMLFMGNKQGDLLAYDTKGHLQWRVHLSSELATAPQAADGIVVTRTIDGHIYGHDVADGKQRWMETRTMPTLTVRGGSGTTVDRGGAFLSLPGGKLIAFNVMDGHVGWESTISMPLGATELERVNDVLGSPVLGYRDICVAAYQSKVSCLEAQRGTVIWTHDIAAIGPLAHEEGKLYVTDEKGDVVALNRITGSVAWKSDALEGRYPSSPAALEDSVAVGDVEGVVHFLNREDGAETSRHDTDNAPIVMQPLALGDGMVLVVNQQGGVYVLGPAKR